MDGVSRPPRSTFRAEKAEIQWERACKLKYWCITVKAETKLT